MVNWGIGQAIETRRHRSNRKDYLVYFEFSDPTYASTTSSKDPHMYMELKTLKALQPGSEKNGNDGYETPQVPGQANKSSDGYETPQPPREGRRRSTTYANQGNSWFSTTCPFPKICFWTECCHVAQNDCGILNPPIREARFKWFNRWPKGNKVMAA